MDVNAPSWEVYKLPSATHHDVKIGALSGTGQEAAGPAAGSGLQAAKAALIA